MDSELYYLSAGQLSRLIRDRKVSPVEVVEAHLARIDALEPQLNSFITLVPERALAAARQAEQEIGSGRYRGPLHGVPLALKDLYYVKGIRNTSGSRLYDDFVPDYDCTIAARFREAGAILLGKLNLHQFAYGPTGENPDYGHMHNPWNPERNGRRLQWRLWLGRRLGPVHPDHGKRHRRLCPYPRRPVRPGGAKAHLRPAEPLRTHPPLVVPGPSGAHDPHR